MGFMQGSTFWLRYFYCELERLVYPIFFGTGIGDVAAVEMSRVLFPCLSVGLTIVFRSTFIGGRESLPRRDVQRF